MQFLRTLFWIMLFVFLAIIAMNNWTDVTINLWGSLRADIKLPLLVLLAMLAGFLPTFLWLRARLWALKRRLALVQSPVPPQPAREAPTTPPEPTA